MTSPLAGFTFLVLLVTLGAGTSAVARAEHVRTGGTGAVHDLISELGAAYIVEEPAFKIEVVPALGSTGAIKALAAGVLDIAVSSRPLKAQEAARDLREIGRFRTPFVLATSRKEPQDIASAEVATAFSTPDAKWQDGKPLRIVLRPESESDSELLQDYFPGMAEALKSARTRLEVPVAATDLDNTRTAEVIEGSLTSATLVQLMTERRDLRAIMIDGVEPTLENLESGRYPYKKIVRIYVSAQPSEAAKRFSRFLTSPAAAELMRRRGIVPALR